MNEIFILIRSHKKIAGSVTLLLAGLLLGYWLGNDSPSTVTPGNASYDTGTLSVNAAVAGQNLMPGETVVYVCPMMCVPPREKPGDCPVCGMTLVETIRDDSSLTPRLTLDPDTIGHAHIRTAPVERRFVSAEVHLFGQVEYDPVHISYLSAYVPGVIDRIYVERAGQTVRWGDPLFDIYSPEILRIEEQMTDALALVPGFYSLDESKPHIRARSEVLLDRQGNLSNPTPDQRKALETIGAMRQKLVLLGMEQKDIDELMKKGEPSGIATIYSQRTGTVIEQNAFEGTYVNTGTPVFAIANPKYIWVRLKAYESDYPWIRIGQNARFVTDAFPGETFHGTVASIDPIFDTQSRSFDVGVIFSDEGKIFRPSMYVRAIIDARLSASGRVVGKKDDGEGAPLVIPATAPLITGRRAVVYVVNNDREGTFEGREITLGPRARDHYVVLAGLKEGERIVVNGNFKIDSQVQILAKPSMMTISGGHRADAHQQSAVSRKTEEEMTDHSRMDAPNENGSNSAHSIRHSTGTGTMKKP